MADDDLRSKHAAWLSGHKHKLALIKNPCIKLYGEGPEGRTCATCAFLYAKRSPLGSYRCHQRDETEVLGQHDRAWPACARFEDCR